MKTLLMNLSYLITSYIVIHESAIILNSEWESDCERSQRFSRIIGGQETQPHEYPSASGLFKNNVLYCGATILSKSHLLTAAHCIYNFSPSEILVFVGGHKIGLNFTSMEKVSLILNHELFNAASFDNDIGLVKIETPLTFGPHAQPACLPKYTDFSNYFGKLAIVLGWGDQRENKLESPVLRSIVIPVWSQYMCKQSGYGPKRLTANMMCAGFEEGLFDACQGDSGGPMLHMMSNGHTEIIGIISWGRGCGRPRFPGVYTIVSHYKKWIQTILSSELQ